jgi:hypothetical protein
MKFSFETSIPVQFDTLEPLEDSRFLKAKVWVCHTGKNLNNSYFSKEVIQNAIPSLANIPVLGFIRVDNLNETDFAGHEQRIIIDKDGARLEYLGRVYGLVPETNNAKFETKICEDGVEREFLTVEVLLYTKFQECIDIIQRDGVKGHSMELQPSSIKGKFNKNNEFEFTEFKFEGLCLLGDDVTPAMRGSVLELFSAYNYNDQFAEMLKEFNSKFSHLSSIELNVANNNPQGGENVNEKLELFTKFPTLKEEDIADLKANIESYSFEELEAKLNELVANQQSSEGQVNDTNINSNFSLTAQQLEQELRAELSKMRFIDRWGDSVRQYWYIDHDENRVYAEDGQNGYLPVGINYSLNGDNVEIDYSSVKRIKWVPQDLEDGSDTISTMMSVERSEAEVSKVRNEYSTYKQEAESKYAELQSKFASKEADFSSLQEEFNELKAQYEEVNGKYTSKLQKEKEEKLNNLFDNFSKELSEEEIAEVRKQKDELSFEELETKLFALVGKKKARFSFETKKPSIIDLEIENYSNKKKTGKSYDELFEKYID